MIPTTTQDRITEDERNLCADDCCGDSYLSDARFLRAPTVNHHEFDDDSARSAPAAHKPTVLPGDRRPAGAAELFEGRAQP